MGTIIIIVIMNTIHECKNYRNLLQLQVDSEGFEPPTSRVQGERSTN